MHSMRESLYETTREQASMAISRVVVLCTVSLSPPVHIGMPVPVVSPRRSIPSGSTAPLRCTTCVYLSEKEVRIGSSTDAGQATKILHSHSQRLALGSD